MMFKGLTVETFGSPSLILDCNLALNYTEENQALSYCEDGVFADAGRNREAKGKRNDG